MAIVFSAVDSSSGENVHRFGVLAGRGHTPMAFHSVDGDVNCEGRLRPIASNWFFDVSLPSCRIGGSPAPADRRDQGYGDVGLVLEGKAVISQDGRQAVVGAGDFAFLDGTRASRVVVPDNLRVIGVVVPLEMISLPRPVLDGVTATRLNGASGCGALLAAFLTTLAANLGTVRPEQEAGLSAAVGDLLAAALANAAETGADLGADGGRSALVKRIRCYVDAEISDPGLSPARIAAAHHMSVRQLHRVFEGEDMTIAELVRARRLTGCGRDLADPALGEMSIGAVAARWGITDSAKFSRLFRAAYGLSPREYRAGNGRSGTQRQEQVH